MYESPLGWFIKNKIRESENKPVLVFSHCSRFIASTSFCILGFVFLNYPSTYIRQKKRQSSELFLSFFAKRLLFQFIFYGIKIMLPFFVYYFLFSID